MNRKIDELIKYAQSKLITEVAAHDFNHSQRVMKIASIIGEKLNADINIIQAAAITHDVIDKKVAFDVEMAKKELKEKLQQLEYSTQDIEHIFSIIENVSFSNGTVPRTVEGKIVQDADRLEAIGAIAIARTFAYGGTKNRPIYDKDDSSNSIQHFYDKLFKLKDMLNTKEAKQIAENRHKIMEDYVNQFFSEWNLEDIK